jgi:hypothetical protein
MSTMTIEINCGMKKCEPVCLPRSATGRDLYLSVSTATNLSRRLFKLYSKSQSTLIPDGLIPLADYRVVSGSQVSLLPNLQSGSTGSNFEQIDPARQAIHTYVFSLSAQAVKAFFDAEAEIRVPIPVGRQSGVLKFRLHHPLPTRSLPADDELDINSAANFPNIHRFRCVKRPDDRTMTGKFSGSLPSECYDSYGVPGRTVDTMVQILENVLETSGF